MTASTVNPKMRHLCVLHGLVPTISCELILPQYVHSHLTVITYHIFRFAFFVNPSCVFRLNPSRLSRTTQNMSDKRDSGGSAFSNNRFSSALQ